MSLTHDSADIESALQALAAALQDPDPAAWVAHYTEDAVFDGGGESAIVGREALLSMARSMSPLRSVSITPLRIEVSETLAAAWCTASWVSGPETADSESTRVRGLLLMRLEDDGVWRVAIERIG